MTRKSVTRGSVGGNWKSVVDNSLVAYPTARTVLRREAPGNRCRLSDRTVTVGIW